jgi:NitT/TauT family transport system permease protein
MNTDKLKYRLGKLKPSVDSLKKASTVILTFIIIVIAWQVIVTVLKTPSWLIPSPYDIFLSYVNDASSYIWKHVLATLNEVVWGFAAGVAVGIVLGIAVFYSTFLKRVVYPMAIFIKVIPIIAIAPILTVWFGFGIESKVIITALITFFPVLVSTILGLASVDTSMIDLMNSLSASGIQVFFKVRWQWALPYIFSALKISITSAVIGAVIGEFVGAPQGLGSMMLIAQSYMDTQLMFVMLAALAIMGIVLFGLVCVAEILIVPWASSTETKT